MLYVPPGFALGINVEIKILKWRTNPCEHIYSLFCFQDSYMCMYAWILPYVGATTWLLKPPRWVCVERVANIREEFLSFAAPSEVFQPPFFPSPASWVCVLRRKNRWFSFSSLFLEKYNFHFTLCEDILSAQQICQRVTRFKTHTMIEISSGKVSRRQDLIYHLISPAVFVFLGNGGKHSFVFRHGELDLRSDSDIEFDITHSIRHQLWGGRRSRLPSILPFFFGNL